MHLDLTALCAGAQAGDERALEDLYKFVRRLCWYWSLKQLGTDRGCMGAQDCVQDTYIAVVKGIRNAAVHNPEALAGFVRTINLRRIALIVAERVRDRNSLNVDDVDGVSAFDYHDAEHEYKYAEKHRILVAALAQLKPREREILTRFYLLEQKVARICREMDLTATQFRLLKSRSKEKLGVAGKKILAGKNRNALRAKIAA